MFGLARQSRLKAAEKREIGLRVELAKRSDLISDLRRELAAERLAHLAAEVENERLERILTAHPVEELPAAEPAKATEPAPIGMPRQLSGFEVVARATQHRNTHNKALERR